nr:MAG TPA: hypothetical protein [Caudoviricetes sp.]
MRKSPLIRGLYSKSYTQKSIFNYFNYSRRTRIRGLSGAETGSKRGLSKEVNDYGK